MTVELRSLIRTTSAKFGPTSATRPASAPPSAIDDVALRDPVVGALADRDERRASLDSRAMTSAAAVLYANAVPELEQPGQLLVLALDASRRRRFSAVSRSFSRRSAALSEWSRSISRDRADDAGDRLGDVVDRALDRPDREAPSRSGTRGRRGLDENAMSTRLIAAARTMNVDRTAAGGADGEAASRHRATQPTARGELGPYARRPGVGVGDEDAVHRRVAELLEDDAGPAGDAGQRVVGDVDRHLGRFRDAPVEARQERAAAGQHDPLVHDVGDELRRRLLDRVLDRVDDLRDGRLDRLADLVGADLDAARQAGQQVAAAERDALLVPLARDRRTRSRS